MEQVESLACMDWSSLMSGMMYTNGHDEPDFMAQLLSIGLDSDFFSTSSAPFDMSAAAAAAAAGNTSSQHLSSLATSQGSGSSSSSHGFYSKGTSSQDTSMALHQLLDSSSLPPLACNEGNHIPMSTTSYLAQSDETFIPNNKDEQQKPDILDAGHPEEKPGKGTKKRSRATGGEPKKAKKSVRSKKVGKKQHSSAGAKKMEEQNNNVKSAAATTTSNSDESLFDGSAADEKIDEGGEAVPTTSTSTGSITVSLNGKTRASRGAATDPQSLYARKRRERINERLKVLQTLVPNGTKVDISTMLEEAVQYVKFLQLQIKLLSSDDHWMYSPIAYNGMDIGVYRCS